MLQGYRRIAAVLVLLVPTVLSFFGINLPSDALNGVFEGFDKVIAAVLTILSIVRPAPAKVGPGV